MRVTDTGVYPNGSGNPMPPPSDSYGEFTIPVLRKHWPLLLDASFRKYLTKVAGVQYRFERVTERLGYVPAGKLPSVESSKRTHHSYKMLRAAYAEEEQERREEHITEWLELCEALQLDADRAEYLRQEK